MGFAKVISAFAQHPSISTDTRKIRKGDLFFALRGEHFDGNQFAAQALESGAAFVVVDNPAMIPTSGGWRYILVEDTLVALQQLALEYRRRFAIPVIGITGTNGKTTTKELVHAALATERRVHATAGNLNNHIGVPLTLLAMPQDTEVAIIEMGANKPGDIAELAAIAEPTHALITNIGRAHLERFGDIEGVRKTKGELFDFLRTHGGMAWVNMADDRVVSVAQGIERVVRYGTPDADVYIQGLVCHPDHLELEIHHRKAGAAIPIRSHLIGGHNAENILVAVAVAIELGISIPAIQHGIATYVPKLNRTELLRGPGFTVLLDAYNANPSSMEATLRSIATQSYGRMALVLGDMFELGEESPRLHRELVELVHSLLPSARLIGVGKEMVAAMAGFNGGVAYPDVKAANPHIASDVAGVDFVLIKGSRGMALENLLGALGLERKPQGH